jgi:DNA-binding response OmpR family regulator
MRLLLVEDDHSLAGSLIRGLRERAFIVDHAEDGEVALYKADVNSYDAIILDVNLPRRDGFAVCRELRGGNSVVRIIMLTARAALGDRVEGLDSGADDYLVKPFELAELVARLRALLRRTGERLESDVLVIDDLEVDLRAQRARRSGETIDLTTKEFVLLAYLARNAGKVVGRSAISEHVWDENHDPSSNLIEVYVNRLRKKVDRPENVALIHTRRGAGYFLGSVEPQGTVAH